jgi:hypothetical protein
VALEARGSAAPSDQRQEMLELWPLLLAGQRKAKRLK